MQFSTDTIAAVATPPGEGGIAVIRISGPDAPGIASRVFRPHRGGDPATFAGYTVHYGVFADPGSGEVVDDGLLTLFRGPSSYTGEHTAELSCHGGRLSTARVLRLVLGAGARAADPGEFTMRAFLNGRLDLAQAEAVADVIRARTEAARRVARRQLDGALSQEIRALREELIGIVAAIEVTIDFSDEVGELDLPALQSRLQSARERVEKLLATADRGRILREGLHVAIIGRPNVGKSSLLNALLRWDRAIVTPIAGTTRDVVEESASIGGAPVVLIDTAGMRTTADTVERIGVERAEKAAGMSDVILFVFDASAGYSQEDAELAQHLFGLDSAHVLTVANKIDQLSPGDQRAVLAQASRAHPLPGGDILPVSAVAGDGLEALEAAIVRIAGGTAAEDSGERTAGPGIDEQTSFQAPVLVASERHRHALEAAYGSLREAESTARQEMPGDFIAIDVRGALEALGLITGETVTEDIIHRIFHDFCVGK